ncbi:MAG: hypothetical protein U9Q88_02725 [Bacillota bacterium]|nr:hypothetical protein [Bacillota bacterium]
MEKENQNDLAYGQLIDGMKVSIIDLFVKHIQNVDDVDTLRKIKKELLKGVKA